MDKFGKTTSHLEQVSALNDTVMVSYSGGKDSLVVLDLCRKNFKHVKCFFMYFVPGLKCVESMLEYARQKWKVEIIQYPHWAVPQMIKHGIYCHPNWRMDGIKEFKLKDIYAQVIHDTGVELIATGAKGSDSMWRRRFTQACKKSGDYDFLINPIYDWNKFDVLAYLKINDIPLPDSSGKNATGIDLSTPSLLWLYDNYPEDFKTLLKYFPFAEAVIKRREYYGEE